MSSIILEPGQECTRILDIQSGIPKPLTLNPKPYKEPEKEVQLCDIFLWPPWQVRAMVEIVLQAGMCEELAVEVLGLKG